MLPVLQAERQLLAIEAVLVPKITEGARRSVFARYRSLASGRRQSRPTTPEELRVALATSTIPVVEIPKEVK